MRSSASTRTPGLDADLACNGELESVPEQVDEDLSHALAVEHHLSGSPGVVPRRRIPF